VDGVKIMTLTACFVGGVVRARGEEVEASQLEALELVEASRARLMTDADLPALLKARRADVAKKLREAGADRWPGFIGDGPWRPAGS
jgi:hypothetical protein